MKLKRVLIEGGVAYGFAEKGRLPFEDQDGAKQYLIDRCKCPDESHCHFMGKCCLELKDGCYSVSMNVSAIFQHRWLDCADGEWFEGKMSNIDPITIMTYQERKVLRIN